MKTRQNESEGTLNQFTPSEKSEKREDSSQRVLLSSQDAYIHDRMKTQPQTLAEIEVLDRKIPEDQHRLSLPPEIKKFEDRYAFRWLFKHKQSIDHACNVRGWYLVNRTYFPDLPDHLFTVSGSVEEGDAILSFIPKKKAEEMRKAAGEKSSEMVRSRMEAHKHDPRFYKPEEKGENVVMI